MTIAIYGHPNQALESNDQSAQKLARFLDTFEKERADGLLQLHTMAQIETFTRAEARP